MMMKLRAVAPGRLALIPALILMACGENAGLVGPVIDRADVAGVYNLTTLTFDPQGSLPARDVLALLEQADRPQLVLGRTDNTFQLAFRDPTSGLIEPLTGTYDLLARGVRLNFPAPSDGQRLLLPQRVDLMFAAESITLTFEGTLSVPLPRLRELVPAFREEPLSNPVPGRLALLFTLDRR